MGRFDRLRVEQVLVNLVSNALKYGEGRPVDVTVRAEAGTAVIEIRDRGIGVPPDKLPEIFERFGRAVSSIHYGGLGLGLYIVRRIVESHGGSVTCESRGISGEGSTFRVTLPSGEA
jgi:signal transduction histidine kinase